MKCSKFIYIFIGVFWLIANTSFGQITQTVKGNVLDNESQYPIIGAMVKIIKTENDAVLFRTTTDIDGAFTINNVPIGKYDLEVSYTLYKNSKRSIIVDSGKETIVAVYITEDISTTEQVDIIGNKSGDVLNEMATVSAQQFSVEETNRYAGSRMDPARMASNYAGVQGADDSRNDIIIRGNSPIGLLYRVEGVDIPNPNHFAVSGSAGGPVGILNNKILANSDFFMSAFPAEYGNSIAGIFDLRLRNGNADKHEITGQFGFLGTEFMAEGPLSKEGKGSYLAMGRYSTLSIFQELGISIGTDAVPNYGDAAFKINLPLKNSTGQLSFWGMGGSSNIDIKISEQTEVVEEAFGEGDRDQYFSTAMGVIGTTFKKPFSEKTFWKTSIAGSYEHQESNHDFLIRSVDTVFVEGQPEIRLQTDSIYDLMSYTFDTYRLNGYSSVNHKINSKHIIKAGLSFDNYFINNRDSALNVNHDAFILRHDFQGHGLLLQPFVQYKWRVSERMDVTAGVHQQFFTLSNSASWVEPRIGWQYRHKKGHIFKAGAGMHSQMQPLYQYTYHRYNQNGEKDLINKNMDFTRSIHTALGYEKAFKNSFVFKSEVYFQQLYNIPVDAFPSAFSLINQGSGFQRFFPNQLVNEGTGRNYGIEFTVQKYFDKSFFLLATASFFESKYTASDGVERNTDFNGRYAANFLAGKEFKINDKSLFSAGIKVTGVGGRWYGYVDREASLEVNELVFLDSAFNTRQFRDYFRLDFKVTYKLNTPKLTHEIGLDLVNVLNTKNILALSYAPNILDPSKEPTAERLQLGFLPIFYYKVDFRIAKNKKLNP